jgi:hypothetical protein
VIAAAVHGVDSDVRQIADELASHGYIVAAPDLFWRSIPGPLGRDDNRTKERSQPRLPKIKAGETDMTDALAELIRVLRFDGKAITMGFLLRRAVRDPRTEAPGLRGRRAAPPPVQEAYREIDRKMSNVEGTLSPGVLHGYMMPDSVKPTTRRPAGSPCRKRWRCSRVANGKRNRRSRNDVGCSVARQKIQWAVIHAPATAQHGERDQGSM